MPRIYSPTLTTIRATTTLLELREYADHAVELRRDDADCGDVRWRTHWVIIDGQALSYRSEDAAIGNINDHIEMWDDELAAAE